MIPTFPRDYHRHSDHKWRNNRHGLDDYYSRHDAECRSNTMQQKRSVAFMSILTLLVWCCLIACIFWLAGHSDIGESAQFPATTDEKESALRHVMSTVIAEDIRLYNYYAERAR